MRVGFGDVRHYSRGLMSKEMSAALMSKEMCVMKVRH